MSHHLVWGVADDNGNVLWLETEAEARETLDEYLKDEAWADYKMDAFIDGYEQAADSDNFDGPDEELVNDYIVGWHPDTMKQFAADCVDFARDNVLDLVASGLDPRRAGADFWLTRNRHGAGFWDEGYREPEEANKALKRLTDASHAYGSAELYVGDDGWIYQS